MNKKIIAIYILNEVLSLAVMGVALFWSAGRLDWWAGWGAIVVMFFWLAGVGLVNLHFQPGLLAERLKPPKGARSWDKVIVSMVRLAQLARYILAGLDLRYGWTGGFPMALQIAALMVGLLSVALFVWAMASNRFFSQIVRIQTDRGHVVTTAGPYRYVRHPGYAGSIVLELALGVLLASWWGLFASGICAVLLVVRTALEDRTLQAELTGYADYAGKVRYRLVPGIW